MAATPTAAQPQVTGTRIREPVDTPLPLAATDIPGSPGPAAKGGGAYLGFLDGERPPGYPADPYPYPPYPYPTPRPCLDDSLEHNDMPWTAWPVALSFRAPGLRVCLGDDDFFAFPLAQGETVQVKASFSHADGNINIVLLGPEGMPVAFGDSRTDNETMTYACCGAAGIGTYTVKVYLYHDDGPLVGNSYDLDISSVQPTPCAPEGCPTPTVMPTPSGSLDFSLGIDMDGDTTDDCGTRNGETPNCIASLADTMTVRVYLNGLPEDVASYEGFDIVLTYGGMGSKDNADAHLWPGCVFQATYYEPELVAFGCAAVHPSAHIGIIGTSDFNCPSTAAKGTITMLHGPGNTTLVQPRGILHYEGLDAAESLSINCVQAPPTSIARPTASPSPTSSPTPSPSFTPPAPSPTSGGGGAALDMGSSATSREGMLPVELSSVSEHSEFGKGPLSEKPEGIILGYGLYSGSDPVAEIFGDFVIAPSSQTQTFFVFTHEDPDFDSLVSGLNEETPWYVHVGFSGGFAGQDHRWAKHGADSALDIPAHAVIDFFRLTVPPFSIEPSNEQPPGFEVISPGHGEVTLAAFGPPPLGDVDCDGAIGSIDAAVTLHLEARSIASAACDKNADVNQDNVINAVDATLILQYNAALIEDLPPTPAPARLAHRPSALDTAARFGLSVRA